MKTKPFTTAEIRSAFLEYFAEQQHKIVHSASLVPGNDPTLLFINAGMVPFKDIFTGQETRSYKRATSAQRCVRAGGKHNDLENVGYTARHHTFFEMMGNFSFGDYFKAQAIPFAWNLLTQVFQLPKEKLLVTVYHEDDEAFNIWHEQIGVPKERIIRIGDKPGKAKYDSDNFWAMGDTGPCGPCSEIFYDHGADIWGGPPGSTEEDGDRFIEIWNIVFMQFERDAQGNMKPLPKPSIDTGMGLERMAAVMQGVHSNYEIDLFVHLIKAAADVTGCADLENNSLKVIADHIRSAVFLMVDGVIPSNEGRGYVLRRIMRRAMRHGHKIGADELFFYRLVAPLIAEMGEAYPEIIEAQSRITNLIEKEEQRFAQTLDSGMMMLEKDLQNLQGGVIPGETVFKLYDTYGFPVDLTNDIARERSLSIDMEGYEMAMQAQRTRAKLAGKFKAEHTYPVEGKTQFSGYEAEKVVSSINALLHEADALNKLEPGQRGVMVLAETPFYAESGGQVGDTGIIKNQANVFIVENTQKQGDTFLHFGYVQSGHFSVNDVVEAEIDGQRRAQIKRHHSATHLLHKALKIVLGDHVQQKGSLVDDHKTRFDFSHDSVISHEDICKIEQLVNRQVLANKVVDCELLTYDQAIEKGATALFGEKYGDEVRVLSMGVENFSIELCGGTHVSRTGDIGLIKIISQNSVSAGIRRIEAVAGTASLTNMQLLESNMQEVTSRLKSDGHNVIERIEQLLSQLKTAEKSIQQLKRNLASGGQTQEESPVMIKGWRTLSVRRDGFDNVTLRDTADRLRDKLDLDVVVIGSVDEDTARIVVSVSKKATTLKAGDIIKYLVQFIDGKGGGRPDFAQAGGRNPAGMDQVFSELVNILPDK